MASSLVVFALARFIQFSGKPLLLADACGLALFTILGVEKSLRHGVPPTIAVAMGVMTGVAGGMIRDVLTREIPLVFRREIYLYATASFCGALLFVLLTPFVPSAPLRISAIAVTLALRLAAIAWRIKLPEFHAKDH